jgi:hypothetical protein
MLPCIGRIWNHEAEIELPLFQLEDVGLGGGNGFWGGRGWINESEVKSRGSEWLRIKGISILICLLVLTL